MKHIHAILSHMEVLELWIDAVVSLADGFGHLCYRYASLLGDLHVSEEELRVGCPLQSCRFFLVLEVSEVVGAEMVIPLSIFLHIHTSSPHVSQIYPFCRFWQAQLIVKYVFQVTLVFLRGCDALVLVGVDYVSKGVEILVSSYGVYNIFVCHSSLAVGEKLLF